MTFNDFLNGMQELLRKLFGSRQNAPPPDIVLNSQMSTKISEWDERYKGGHARDMRTMNLASAICSEIAQMVTLELKSEITGSKRADYLNEAYQKFLKNIRFYTEYACAKGGIIFKPYVSNSEIYWNAVQADGFFPTAFDSSGRIIGAIFTEQLQMGKKYYTRLEYHKVENKKCKIINAAYESDNSSIVGKEIPLTSVSQWADLEPETVFDNVDFPLFSYFKIPGANYIDPDSPLGVSVFAKAMDMLDDADEIYTMLLWEFKSGRRKIFAGADLLKPDGQGGWTLPDGCDSDVFIGLYDDGKNKIFEQFSPEFRDEAIRRGMNDIFRKIELLCGVAYGTISNVEENDKTATEVKMSKQRTYATVFAIQESLKSALEDFVKAMDFYVSFYNLAPKGNYSLNTEVDDSIIVDAETQQKILLQEVAAGLATPEEYRMKIKGEDEETARANLPKNAFEGDI